MADQFDALITGATIVDGSGQPAYQGSIGVRGERIAALGAVSGVATTVIDGAGLIACPGFVDPHSHVELGILQYPLAENAVMQGITTFVGGHCGITLAPAEGETTRQQVQKWLGSAPW